MMRLSYLLGLQTLQALALLVLLLLVTNNVALGVGAQPTSAVPLPHGTPAAAVSPSVSQVPGLKSLVPAAAPAPKAVAGAAPATPAATLGCTPGSPNELSWASNVSVVFSTPLNYLPAPNQVGQFDNAIQITITTTYPGMDIVEAYMTVWAVGWNNGVLTSTEPSAPGVWTFQNNSQNYQQATGQLNNYKYFPPGSTVYFNLTLVQESVNGVNWLYSPCADGILPANSNDYPTWEYTMGGGWPSTTFTNDINITAVPNIFAGIQPSSDQAVLLYLNSANLSNDLIGGANLHYSLTNSTGTFTGGWYFLPKNSTYESLADGVGIGPFAPDTTVKFWIQAWVLWDGGAVNYIFYQNFTYKVSFGGTWCDAAPGFYHYISLNSTPANATLYPLKVITVPALTEINITILSLSANTTIAYAYVDFNETYEGVAEGGDVLMTAINATSQYTGNSEDQPLDASALPFLEPGMNFSFYVTAFDSLRCEIRSDTYHIVTVKAPPPTRDRKTYFYVVVENASAGEFVPGVPVNISNATWTDLTQTNLLGFAYPNLTSSDVPAYLNYGYYNVTVIYKGQTQSIDYDLTPTSNKTLTFIFTVTTMSPPVYAAAVPVDSLGLYFGLAAAAVAVIPIYNLWRDQRRKAEAEEKRITL